MSRISQAAGNPPQVMLRDMLFATAKPGDNASLMRAGTTMAWASFEDVSFVVHAPGPPSDVDWSEHMADAHAGRPPKSVLVIANDSSVSPKQRQDIQKWVAQSKARLAIVTRSMMTRGAVTALSWFGVQARAFSPEHLDQALDYAGIDKSRRAEARSLLGEMERSIRTRAGGVRA